MKQDKRPAGAAVKKRRFFNRISRKLMLFVVLMSMVLLALVWLLSVKLLEPMYNRRVLADLNHAADVYSAIIEKYGKFESFDKSGGVHIPSDMMEEIMDNRGLLAGKCFEVAGTDCKVLLHLHQFRAQFEPGGLVVEGDDDQFRHGASPVTRVARQTIPAAAAFGNVNKGGGNCLNGAGLLRISGHPQRSGHSG